MVRNGKYLVVAAAITAAITLTLDLGGARENGSASSHRNEGRQTGRKISPPLQVASPGALTTESWRAGFNSSKLNVAPPLDRSTVSPAPADVHSNQDNSKSDRQIRPATLKSVMKGLANAQVEKSESDSSGRIDSPVKAPSESAIARFPHNCGDYLDANNLPEFFCKYEYDPVGREWNLVDAKTPNKCHCEPPDFYSLAEGDDPVVYLYPCVDAPPPPNPGGPDEPAVTVGH